MLIDFLLYRIAKKWPSPVAQRIKRLGTQPGEPGYAMAYAQEQYDARVRNGIKIAAHELDVLEVGCGHGGITCFLAVTGARSVTGIDLDTERLECAERFASLVSKRFGQEYKLPVHFKKLSATKMDFPDSSFDLVLADNVFEHFTEPETVMKEICRVLRPKGKLVVPSFSSIYSKHGLHLKHGLKIPWGNIFFSEKTIVAAMHRLAKDQPLLKELYPGLEKKPERVRDLRLHRDLNDITYKEFKNIAKRSGLSLNWFSPNSTLTGKFVYRIPVLRESILMEILSTGASALLTKEPA